MHKEKDKHENPEKDEKRDLDNSEKSDSTPDIIQQLQESIKSQEEVILQKDKEIEELKSKFLRFAAEAENMKKRLERDKREFLDYSNETLIKDILPILDNIERALEHADEKSDIKDFIKGINITMLDFMKVLAKYDVKVVQAVNNPFDPAFHEAMSVVESNDVAPNTVVKELQKGYMLKERLLRPSLVVVSKQLSNKQIDNKN